MRAKVTSQTEIDLGPELLLDLLLKVPEREQGGAPVGGEFQCEVDVTVRASFASGHRAEDPEGADALLPQRRFGVTQLAQDDGEGRRFAGFLVEQANDRALDHVLHALAAGDGERLQPVTQDDREAGGDEGAVGGHRRVVWRCAHVHKRNAACLRCQQRVQCLHEVQMATLTIRNVDDVVKERLRVRAARHGHSMEADLRAIGAEALEKDEQRGALSLAEAIRRRFAPFGGVELEPHPQMPAREPPDFSE